MQSAAPHHIARIVEGNRPIELFGDFDPPGLDQIVIELDGVDDGKRRHGPSQPAVAHIVNTAKRMAAFAHDDFFYLEALGSLKMRPFEPAP